MPAGKCGECKYYITRDGDGYCNDKKQKEPDEPCGYYTSGQVKIQLHKIRNKEW